MALPEGELRASIRVRSSMGGAAARASKTTRVPWSSPRRSPAALRGIAGAGDVEVAHSGSISWPAAVRVREGRRAWWRWLLRFSAGRWDARCR